MAELVPTDRQESRRLVKETFGLETPFALNVGGNFPRKNLRRLLEATARASVFQEEHSFGLPPLEALQYGTPVAMSDRDPFPEVRAEHNALL